MRNVQGFEDPATSAGLLLVPTKGVRVQSVGEVETISRSEADICFLLMLNQARVIGDAIRVTGQRSRRPKPGKLGEYSSHEDSSVFGAWCQNRNKAIVAITSKRSKKDTAKSKIFVWGMLVVTSQRASPAVVCRFRLPEVSALCHWSERLRVSFPVALSSLYFIQGCDDNIEAS